jgi:FKBP-type peptidyl-prolyl cis-trans isomerase
LKKKDLVILDLIQDQMYKRVCKISCRNIERNMKKTLFQLSSVVVLSCILSSCGDKAPEAPKQDEAAQTAPATTDAKDATAANETAAPAEATDAAKPAEGLAVDNYKELESGLKYEILTPAAEGAKKVAAGQKVAVHYTGWLLDESKADKLGQKFDSSVDRNQEFSFVVGAGQVIKGWDIALADMSVGEKRRLMIPAHLAYGEHGAGGVIPPSATLIFDVEVKNVEEAAKA